MYILVWVACYLPNCFPSFYQRCYSFLRNPTHVTSLSKYLLLLSIHSRYYPCCRFMYILRVQCVCIAVAIGPLFSFLFFSGVYLCLSTEQRERDTAARGVKLSIGSIIRDAITNSGAVLWVNIWTRLGSVFWCRCYGWLFETYIECEFMGLCERTFKTTFLTFFRSR